MIETDIGSIARELFHAKGSECLFFCMSMIHSAIIFIDKVDSCTIFGLDILPESDIVMQSNTKWALHIRIYQKCNLSPG